METHCGAASRKTLTKFPARTFTDYAAQGSLSMILKACMNYKVKKNWKSFDWRSKSSIGSNSSMLRYVNKELRKGGFLQTRVVFLSSRVPIKLKDRIVRILKSRDAELTDDMKEASLVVTYDESVDDVNHKKNDSKQYRVIELNRESGKYLSYSQVDIFFFTYTLKPNKKNT